MKIDGGCQCGAITYEGEIDPEQVRMCHCTDCQRMSGTAFRVNGFVPEADIRFTGTPKIYVKIGDSGARRLQAFCADCGTHVYACAEGDGPKVYGIRLGTSNQFKDLPPKLSIWGRSSMPWLEEAMAMPRSPKAA